jgi:Enoyl-(Acyl carrier protein) reductase
MDVADQAGGSYTDADIEGVNPMGRFATPDDIAQAILFLADGERSGFINGQALAVDGGWTTDGSWKPLLPHGVWLVKSIVHLPYSPAPAPWATFKLDQWLCLSNSMRSA